MKFKNILGAAFFLITTFSTNVGAQVTPRSISATSVYNGAGYFYIPTSTPFGDRACYFDGYSTVASSVTTGEELAFLHGVTSPIQTQINSLQPAGSYITALTGDLTASGPGSATATLATVNSNVGSFTNANITVNAKGLITAASSGGITGANTTLSNLTSPVAVNQDFLPGIDNNFNIGSPSKSWQEIYASDVIASGSVDGVSVTGTNAVSSQSGSNQIEIRSYDGQGYTGTSKTNALTSQASLPNINIYSPYNNNGDSSNSGNVTLATGNVTGTGNAGNIFLIPGTSIGGSAGSIQFQGTVSANSYGITNVLDPVNAQDAATKHYVDTHSGPSFTQGSVAFGGPSSNLTQDNASFYWDDTNKALKLGGAVSTGILDVREKSNSLGSGLNLESYDGSKTVSFTEQSSSNFFIYDGVDTLFSCTTSNCGTGNIGSLYKWDVNGTSTLTAVTSAGSLVSAVRNADQTNGNFETFGFSDAATLTSAIAGVNDSHLIGMQTGHLSFQAKNAGTMTEAMTLSASAAKINETTTITENVIGPQTLVFQGSTIPLFGGVSGSASDPEGTFAVFAQQSTTGGSPDLLLGTGDSSVAGSGNVLLSTGQGATTDGEVELESNTGGTLAVGGNVEIGTSYPALSMSNFVSASPTFILNNAQNQTGATLRMQDYAEDDTLAIIPKSSTDPSVRFGITAAPSGRLTPYYDFEIRSVSYNQYGSMGLLTTDSTMGLGSGTGGCTLNPADPSGLATFICDNQDGFNFETFSANGATAYGNIKTNSNGIILNSTNPVTLSGSTTVINSHVYNHGTLPTMSSCGTDAVVTATSTDTSGSISVGGGVSSCSIMFAQAWNSTPHCFANYENGFMTLKVVPTTTGFTISAPSNFTVNDVLDYHCVGNQ